MRRRDFLGAGAAGLATLFLSSRFAHAAPDTAAWKPVFERLPPSLRSLIDDPEYQIQLLWYPIARHARGRAHIRRHTHGLAPRRWFSPASVTKLPMALLMAERLSAQGVGADAQVRLRAAPATGEWPADEPLAEAFRRGCNRTFAVSENVPYNRWYEYLGADAVHARLSQLGYRDTRLIARLGSQDRDANRRSGGGELLAPDGRVVERSEAAPNAFSRSVAPWPAAVG
jgi:hypothetical protein